jgi:hypothetical protein
MSSWSTRFRPPIDPPDGQTIATLADARSFIFELSKAAQQEAGERPVFRAIVAR